VSGPRPRAAAARRVSLPVRAAALVGLAVAALAALLLPAAPASAHAVLRQAVPAREATLPGPPTEVVLTFSETVRAVPGKIFVLGPDGRRVDRGEPVGTGAAIRIPLTEQVPRGTYLVSYRVISNDGHPVAGAYQYFVGAPSVGAPTVADLPGADRTVEVGLAASRYLGYLGLLLIVGPALALARLWPRRLPRRAPARLAWTGAALLGLGTVGALLFQGPYTIGGTLTALTGADLREVLGSRFGVAHLARLALLAAALPLLSRVMRGDAGRASGALLALLGAAALVTWPVAGHAAVSPVPPLSIVLDVAHLAGVAAWLGGLAVLVGFLLRQAAEAELDAILPVWSRWATLAVGGLLLAGAGQALIEVAGFRALLETTYGRLVIGKVALFALLLGAAAYARRLARRGAAGRRTTTRLRRIVTVELAVAALVLGLSAALAQTTPARSAIEAGGAAASGYTGTLSSRLYSLQVQIDPAAVGTNAVHLYAFAPDGVTPLPVQEWRATATLPSAGIEPIEVPLVKLTENHASGYLALPVAGRWEFRFTARTSDIDQATVSATVPVT